jgi:hypothetical protein
MGGMEMEGMEMEGMKMEGMEMESDVGGCMCSEFFKCSQM